MPAPQRSQVATDRLGDRARRRSRSWRVPRSMDSQHGRRCRARVPPTRRLRRARSDSSSPARLRAAARSPSAFRAYRSTMPPAPSSRLPGAPSAPRAAQSRGVLQQGSDGIVGVPLFRPGEDDGPERLGAAAADAHAVEGGFGRGDHRSSGGWRRCWHRLTAERRRSERGRTRASARRATPTRQGWPGPTRMRDGAGLRARRPTSSRRGRVAHAGDGGRTATTLLPRSTAGTTSRTPGFIGPPAQLFQRRRRPPAPSSTPNTQPPVPRLSMFLGNTGNGDAEHRAYAGADRFAAFQQRSPPRPGAVFSAMPFRRSPNLAHLKSSETVAISTEAKRRKAAGEDVLDLGVGEPDFDTPPRVGRRGHCRDSRRQDPLRAQCRHDRVASRDRRRVLADERRPAGRPRAVMVSNGSKQSLFNACFTLFGPRRQGADPFARVGVVSADRVPRTGRAGDGTRRSGMGPQGQRRRPRAVPRCQSPEG